MGVFSLPSSPASDQGHALSECEVFPTDSCSENTVSSWSYCFWRPWKLWEVGGLTEGNGLLGKILGVICLFIFSLYPLPSP